MLRFYENGTVGLRDAFLLPDSQWKVIAGCATIAGYGIDTPEEAEAIYSRLADEAPGGEYIFNDDMAALLREKYGVTSKEDDQQAEEIAEAAEKIFGHPYQITLAGWLTINGKFLNFSEDGFQRDRDHREIRLAFDECGIEVHDEPGSNVAAMIRFMDQGNIRLMNRGADISACPNEKQWDPFEAYLLATGEDSVYVDLSARSSGTRIATLEYAREDIPFIRDDLEEFFETGIYPREKKVS